MLDWLFNIKPKEKPASKAPIAKLDDPIPGNVSIPLSRPEVLTDDLKAVVKEFQEHREIAKQKAGPERVLSVEEAKGSDKLITLGTNHGPTRQFIINYAHSAFMGDWYTYPGFDKLAAHQETPYRKMLDEFKLRQKYAETPPLSMAIKARQGDVKCVYCLSVASGKAQVCLRCGQFLCMECSPSVTECPAGCK